ncbi:jg13699 [Pararge aegeria aegeria]|uniref:RNA helicase n=1 Tax=Pararge aegeria aegeria TaxID=348720 RepID=A0A8S4RLC3_9NEOP|nr:jg13699 [Pararge aegeria aegeria]
MGRKRYNAKARQVVKTSIDDSKTNEIKLDIDTKEYGSTDTSNLLVLPSKKRKTNLIAEKKEKTRFLSKAQRKRFEKIVDKKKKKENRAALLESLSLVQATPEEVNQLTTISSVQTLGLRKLNEHKLEENVHKAHSENIEQKKFSSIAGAKKRLRLLRMDNTCSKKKKYDPNVIGLEELSDDETSSESDAEELEVIENDNLSKDKVNKSLNEHDTPTIIKKEQSNAQENINTVKQINQEKEKLPEQGVKDIKKPLLEHTTVHIEVKRDPKIQVARLKLPILGEEQRIMELVNENEFVIVAGETGLVGRRGVVITVLLTSHSIVILTALTPDWRSGQQPCFLIPKSKALGFGQAGVGSGKTTQLPQFLYEAGYAESKMIGVTEPRRVATVAMSVRVGHELGLTNKHVSYLMRFEGNVCKDTKIKFMTDGVLLKEIQSDFLLSKYSVIIIDEAHERSVYTDILLGLLSRIVPLRRKRGSPLRLIIMSATLRVEDFTENTRLFKIPPPVIKVESRQFPVTIHFNKSTYSDYLKEAYKKTVKIHTRLPEGGILIFVTGQQEVNYLVRKLRASFPYRKDVDYSKLITKKKTNEVDTALDSEPEDIDSDDDEVEKEMKRIRKARRKAKKRGKTLPKINLDDYDMPEDDGQADLVSDDDSEGHLSDSDAEEDSLTPAIKSCRQPLWVLPLYSMLGSSKQSRVFEPTPAGARLCVVSTDVAETSLTIPGVKYVVDTGKKKMRVYDHTTGASAWRIVWTSQASAEQRSGRAGRTSAGHAYRLYSSAVFQHDCVPHYEPDLCRRPVDDLVLMMKCMGIDKVVNFPYPTAPDRLQLRLAEKRLEVLGILEKPAFRNTRRKDYEEVLQVTPLGKAVSAFPILPRYGKMLALSHQFNLLPYSIALVSALTVQEVMTGKAQNWPATGNTLLLGDPGVLLRAVGAAEYSFVKGEEELFCAKYGLREKVVCKIPIGRQSFSKAEKVFCILTVPAFNDGQKLGQATAKDRSAIKMLNITPSWN